MKIFEGYFNNVELQEIDTDDFNKESGNTNDVSVLNDYQYHIYLRFFQPYTEESKNKYEVIKKRFSAYLERFPWIFEQSEPVMINPDTIDGVVAAEFDKTEHPLVIIGFNARFRTSKPVVNFIYNMVPVVCKGYIDELKLRGPGALKYTNEKEFAPIAFSFIYETELRHRYRLETDIKKNWMKCFTYFDIRNYSLVPMYNITADTNIEKMVHSDLVNMTPSGYKLLEYKNPHKSDFIVNNLSLEQFVLMPEVTFFYEPSFEKATMFSQDYDNKKRLYEQFTKKKSTVGHVQFCIYKRGSRCFLLKTVVTFSEGYITGSGEHIEYKTPIIYGTYQNCSNNELDKIKCMWMYRVLVPLFYAGYEIDELVDLIWNIIKSDFKDYSADDVKRDLLKWHDSKK